MRRCYSCFEKPAEKLVSWRGADGLDCSAPYCEGCQDDVCQQLDDEAIDFSVENLPTA